ncbi:MAG: hypothetical protein HRT38_10250 [Alteromonadaceae bacterium]|nr:hypothetical protein [Alteromonadaceae bacterium]
MKLLISAVLLTGLITSLPSFANDDIQFGNEVFVMQKNVLQMNEQLAKELGRDIQMSLQNLQAPFLINLKNNSLVVKNSSKKEITFTEE